MKDKEFVCDFANCGKRFNKRSRFQCHRQSHLALKPFACDFEGCGASYAWRHHLKRHIDSIHSHPEKEFKCSVEMCMATFDTELALRQHTRKSHQIAKDTFACSFCDLTFGKDWQLQEHEASHTKQIAFKCDKCGEGFVSFDLLKKHQRKHKGSKSQDQKYNCKECSEVFETSASLNNHLTSHKRTQDLVCGKCSEVFQLKRDLSEHKLRLHSENPAYRCRICERAYVHEKNLIQHIRQVHEGKLFPCSECGRKLRTKQKLDLHVALHKVAPAPMKPRKKKSAKTKLVSQLTGSADLSVDLDVTERKKPEIKNPHISYVFAAKEKFPSFSLAKKDYGASPNSNIENIANGKNVYS